MSRIVIIGGGATGTGLATEAARRGHEAIVVERGAIGSGTSSHFHGMLHSGARYAVNDPAVASECYQQNQRLRKLVPSAISDTGGLFVAMTDQEAAHADVIQQACAQAGIPFKHVSVAAALRQEPLLNPALKRAFRVADGFIDGAKLLKLNQQAARQAATPATFMTDHTVTGFQRHGQRITAVQLQHATSGATQDIACDQVINAAGVWAGQVAALADVPLTMLYDKGTMIIFNKPLSQAVLNRCRPESDGDLLVPHAGTSIMGTTSRPIDDPDDSLPTQEEADVLVSEGSMLVPKLAKTTALRIYAGVRPLQAVANETLNARSISRSFKILHHQEQGVSNFTSVIGGKVTLYQLMAEATLDSLSG